MIDLILHKNVTPDKLIKSGFKQQSENKMVFRFREKLYKNIISLSIKIDLSKEETEEKIEWYVLDNNTGGDYNAFYFPVNTCRDLVREKVIESFLKVIMNLDKNEVLFMEES